jgi:hypothetical protein
MEAIWKRLGIQNCGFHCFGRRCLVCLVRCVSAITHIVGAPGAVDAPRTGYTGMIARVRGIAEEVVGLIDSEP